MSLRISEDQARKLGIPPATRRSSGQGILDNRQSLKPPAPSRDTRRPWLDTILARTGFKGELGPEDEISAAFAEMLVEAEHDGRSRCVWTHVPNEGKRGRAFLAKLIHLGMVPSSPDFWIVWYAGAGLIEFKAPQSSRDPIALLTPGQKDHRAWCLHHGVRHAVCTSAAEAWRTLVEWGAVVDRP